MNAHEQSILFVGDLDDPWVAAIADALPQEAIRISCVDDWHEVLSTVPTAPSTLVLHRPTLTPRDAERLEKVRKGSMNSPRLILCVGPYARYVDLERCSLFVDVVLPEATARETVLRHVMTGEGRGERRASGTHPPVHVVSDNFEFRQTFAAACTLAGYRAKAASDWSETVSGGIVIWDVPVLESDWTTTLARQAQLASIVTILGFADRALVREARLEGASACLEAPCELGDLLFVLDRLSAIRSEAGHGVPPPPVTSRRPMRPMADKARDTYN